MMKTLRSNHLQKNKTVNKKKTLVAATAISGNDQEQEQKEQTDCNGVCTIVWKPAVVAR